MKKLITLLAVAFCLKTNAQIITTIAGNGVEGYEDGGGPGTNAQLNSPWGIVADALGNIYFADYGNNRIQKVNTQGAITNVAGNMTAGFSGDGSLATGTGAELNAPAGVAVDTHGNIFIADKNNSRIRKVGTNGIITTIAGSGLIGYSGDGGNATAAELNAPTGVAIDNFNNIFIADASNNCIRKVNSNGIITTFAGNGTAGFGGDGGAAISANLKNPDAVAVDVAGNVYVCDFSNSRVRKVDTNGIITTIAGTGTNGFAGDGGIATNAELYYPQSVSIDGFGNVYIADKFNYRIRKINTNGIIFTIAGNGTAGYSGDFGAATNAELNYPSGVVADHAGNIYISDNSNNRVRKVNSNGIITTLAGTGIAGYLADGGPAIDAAFFYPTDVALDKFGNIYAVDSQNNLLRKINTNGSITRVAGQGPSNAPPSSGDGGLAIKASLQSPRKLAIDAQNNIYIRELYRIRKIDSNDIITTVAGNGTFGNSGDGGQATNAEIGDESWGMAFDKSGNLYIAENYGSYPTWGCKVRKVDTNGIITTFAGTGTEAYSGDGGSATAAELDGASGVAVDALGNVFIASNNCVRKVNTSGIINTIAGQNGVQGYSGDGGPATAALFNSIQGISVDVSGNLFITDGSNYVIRMINTGGIITTIAGSYTMGVYCDDCLATSSSLCSPDGALAKDALTGYYYIADYCNNRIRRVDTCKMALVSYTLTANAAPHTWDAFPIYSSNVVSAKWYWGDGTSTTGFYPSHTYSVAGRYNVCVTSFNACGDSVQYCQNDSVYRTDNSSMVYINVLHGQTTGISQISGLNSNISIYPNPNNGSFVIEPQNTLYNAHCTMYDVNGKIVLSQTINGKTSIDASSLNEGVYNISLIINEGVVNKRLVIVR